MSATETGRFIAYSMSGPMKEPIKDLAAARRGLDDRDVLLVNGHVYPLTQNSDLAQSAGPTSQPSGPGRR